MSSSFARQPALPVSASPIRSYDTRHHKTQSCPLKHDNLYEAQYDDLVVKSKDVYAHTRSAILERYLADRSAMRILNVGCDSGDCRPA
jgi:hypothetical protein